MVQRMMPEVVEETVTAAIITPECQVFLKVSKEVSELQVLVVMFNNFKTAQEKQYTQGCL